MLLLMLLSIIVVASHVVVDVVDVAIGIVAIHGVVVAVASDAARY